MRGECHMRQCQHLFRCESDLLRRGDVQLGRHLWRMANLRWWSDVRVCPADMRGFADMRDRTDMPQCADMFRPADMQRLADLRARVHLRWLADLPGSAVGSAL